MIEIQSVKITFYLYLFTNKSPLNSMSKVSRFYMYHVIVTPKLDSELQTFKDMLDHMPTNTTPMKKEGDEFDLNEAIKKKLEVYIQEPFV
ncbi:hypothetical protein MKQ70_16565 [Chitinophaga sedimenti]|uniref:hypothetical protein n=1 Tax=Chitinophaga sedimenti TaxID=2033606 RepID=UPI00200498B6|nr:hypothetical protein [Chitinophaga sedimenti]MCK7556542.1 hypothetical protein [Chitinophaga sedimenti]